MTHQPTLSVELIQNDTSGGIDPYQNCFQVDASGIIQNLGETAGMTTVTTLDPMLRQFSLFAPRTFADRRNHFVSELVEAVTESTGWCGELYGSGRNCRSVYEVEVIPPAMEQCARFSRVNIRDISRFTHQIDTLMLERNEATDLLQLTLSQRGGSENSAAQQSIIFRDFLQSRFALQCSLPFFVEISSDIPEHCLAPVKQLTDVFAGLALHIKSIPKAESCAFRAALREQSGDDLLIDCKLKVNSAAVSTNRILSAIDYLALLEIKALEGIKSNGIGIAESSLGRLSGALTIETTEGEGVSFKFLLHLRGSVSCMRATKETQPVVTSHGVNLWGQVVIPTRVNHEKRSRVLIADDSMIDLMSLQKLLEKAGCDVVTASNGREAVEEFDTGDYDLVLMDILMPVMDGFEAARLIREQERPNGERVPLVALTSYSLKAIYDKCIRVGMDGFISKPVKQIDISTLFKLPSPAESVIECDATEQAPILDVQGTLKNLGGDLTIYKSIVQVFDEETEPALAVLFSEMESGNVVAAGKAAHKLKGMVLALGGIRLGKSLASVEEMALHGKLYDVENWLKHIMTEYISLKNSLSEIHR